MKIAITGHRPSKLGNDYEGTSPLVQAIMKDVGYHAVFCHMNQIYEKNVTFITGMALGIDTWFAELAVSCNIPFIAAIPCFGQAAIWPKKSQDKWRDLLNKAIQIVNVSGKTDYQVEHMQLRNEWMVDNCDILIAVWDGTSGGTANCIAYAKSKQKKIIYINPKELI